MSPSDQARLRAAGINPPDQLERPELCKPHASTAHEEPKMDSPEKDQQKSFANWLLLENKKGRDIPFEWHALHKRSTSTPGCADFWVGIRGISLWIEFKRDYTCQLTAEQAEFARKCQRQGGPLETIQHHIVYSAQAAIGLVETTAKSGGIQVDWDL